MRIALNAPVWLRCPPERYGGTELVVSLLAEELVAMGHDVHLFATGDSLTKASLVSVYDGPQAPIGTTLPDALHSVQAHLRADEFDIIHDHTGPIGASYATLSSSATPVLATLHGDFNEKTIHFFKHFKDGLYYNAISDYQQQCYPDLKYVDTVYNAINIDHYPFEDDKDDFFIFISRISEQKAPHLAIETAKALGERLILAGKIDPGADMDYFKNRVLPLVDGDQIQWLGEVSQEQKIELYGKSKALLFPIQWAEPFGLVMAEALASGTPVVAWRNGAAPEVIEDQKTGFVVDNMDDFIAAARKISEIEPAACRRAAEERFSPARMARDYEARYNTILERTGR